MSIREFRYPEDTDGVVSLMAECGLLESEAGSIREEISVKQKRDPQLFLIYEEDGEIVGAVIGGWDGWRGWMYKLGVAARYRRRGVGSALVKEVVDRLAKLGAKRIGAYAFSNNDASISLLEKNGFVPLDVKHFRLGL